MTITTQNLFSLTTLSLFTLSSLHLLENCDAKCSPSSCGVIRNISSPFCLNGAPKHCGDRRFELSCENSVASISLNSHKYYVKAINYSGDGNYDTIRLVDTSINNEDICSFPTVSADTYNFSNPSGSYFMGESYPINLISCPNPLNNSSLYTDITTQCQSGSANYIKIGRMNASEVPRTCRVDLIVMTSLL